jgi:aromatic-ring opening dioxygenase LigAB LigA subunit
MSIFDTDRTLASNRMIFELRRDMAKYRRFRQDLEGCMAEYGLTEPERVAWRTMDIRALGALGVHPYFLPQVSRLIEGGAYNHNASPAARLYAEKMGVEDPANG